MRLLSGPYEDTRRSSGYQARAWLTPAQLEHSENYIGSERNRLLADAIRDREQIGYDGIVRTRPGLSLSYDNALEFLGMNDDSALS